MYVAYNPSAGMFLAQQDGTHYNTTRELITAKQFSKKTKAQNIIAMVGHMIPGQWVIQESNKALEAITKVNPEKVAGTNDNDILRRINELQLLCQGRQTQAAEEVSNADKELVDMYHFIEFSHFNAAQGYQAYKMLQKVLTHRREAKDEFAALEVLNNVVEHALKTAAKKVPDRKYKPRIRPDLFQETQQ